MKYIGTIAAIATTISSTKNRTLPRWSANSLAAIVRQPPDGRALGAAGGPRGVGALACQRARPSVASGT